MNKKTQLATLFMFLFYQSIFSGQTPPGDVYNIHTKEHNSHSATSLCFTDSSVVFLSYPENQLVYLDSGVVRGVSRFNPRKGLILNLSIAWIYGLGTTASIGASQSALNSLVWINNIFLPLIFSVTTPLGQILFTENVYTENYFYTINNTSRYICDENSVFIVDSLPKAVNEASPDSTAEKARIQDSILKQSRKTFRVWGGSAIGVDSYYEHIATRASLHLPIKKTSLGMYAEWRYVTIATNFNESKNLPMIAFGFGYELYPKKEYGWGLYSFYGLSFFKEKDRSSPTKSLDIASGFGYHNSKGTMFSLEFTGIAGFGLRGMISQGF